MRPILSLAAAAVISFGAASSGLAEAVAEPPVASPWVELHASRARLVASAGKTADGARLFGLQIALDDGWKTYWRMPGDAGVPPGFDWAGSVNAASIKVLYPAPKRMPEVGGEVAGYKGGVLFPVAVTPKDAMQPVALKVAVEYAVCRDICVPITASFELVLPPAGKAGQGTGSTDALTSALERVPRPHADRRPTDPRLVEVSLGKGEKGARLVVAAAFGDGKSGDVFVEAPDSLYVPMLKKEAEGADGTVRFLSDLSADLVSDLKGKTLTFTLVSDAGASEAQWMFPK